jgi:hypothetical protein
MNFGFNSNIRVGESTYHVQTEDRGPTHPFLDTVVYLSGRVVYKRSTNYEKFARGMVEKNLTQWLRERVSQQHRDVIAELEAGTLPLHGKEKAQKAAAKVETGDHLDLRLKNPKSWFVAGNVILEIELREKNSKKAIGEAEVQVCLEQERRRIPCGETTTDAKGCAKLQFPMPADVADGSSLVVRARDGSRFGELRFRLKSKAREKSPAPVS